MITTTGEPMTPLAGLLAHLDTVEPAVPESLEVTLDALIAKHGSDFDVYLGAQCDCMDVEGSDGPDEFCRHCKGSGVPGGEE